MKQKIVKIDLEQGKTSIQPITNRFRRLFLGGRGINIRLLLDLAPCGADPFDPSLPIIIGCGLLTGLPCPSASRCSITGKSPESGLLGDSNLGGHFGAALKRTGFDHLILTGKSKEPCYILVEPDQITLCPASELWGLDTFEVTKTLKKRHGHTAQVLCIGPAGENLVRFACVRHDLKSTAGRGGLGALLGHKKVKAIVVRRGPRPWIAKESELKKLTKRLNSRLQQTRTREVLHKLGTPFLYDLHNFSGVLRTLNGQFNQFKEGKKLRSAALKKFYTGHQACFGCKIVCRHTYCIQDKSGSGQDITGVGPEYGTLGAFGPICGITEPIAIFKINDLVNRLGLDSSSTGNIIAWAMELYQRGILSSKETGGLDLTWGNQEAVLTLIGQIAHCQGFGALLAQGAIIAAQEIGQGSDRYLMWVKNTLQSDSVDLRGFLGFALGVATSTRGADHLRSRPTMEALSLSAQQLEEIYGQPCAPDPQLSLGKARMVVASECEYALGDALGICRFAQRFNSPDHLDIKDLGQLISLATGMEFSEQELIQTGERIITLERLFLVREGVSKKDDWLPPRYFKEPMPRGRLQGTKIAPEQFSDLLDEYYRLHGWDEQGRPGKQRLAELDLEEFQ